MAKALRVREWFKDLNPYGEDNSILQLEKVNFPPDKRGRSLGACSPILPRGLRQAVCPVQPAEGGVVVRKASGHGLGHLMPPYDELPAARRERIERVGVPLWQEDLWKEIIRAAEFEKPDETRFMEMPANSILQLRANMRRQRRSCSDGSMGTTSTSRAVILSSRSAFSCRCKPSRGSKWPKTSPTLSHMNFGADESHGRRRRISRSQARRRTMHSIVNEATHSGVLAQIPCAKPGPLPPPPGDQIPGRRVRPARTAEASARLCVGSAIDRQGSRQHRGKRIYRRGYRSAPLWRRADCSRGHRCRNL